MEFDRSKLSRTQRLKRLAILCVVILVLSFAVIKLRGFKTAVISPVPDSVLAVTTTQAVKPTRAPFTLFAKKKDPDELAQKIQEMVKNDWSNYSVLVQDYGSDFEVAISDTEIYVAASINKIPILAALYYYATRGEIDLDRNITIQAADIQDYGTGSIRYQKPGTVYSVKTLARLMIKQSDNTAAYILANHVIGFNRLKAIVKEWGMTQTDMVKNDTSNRDIALLMRKIYEDKVADHASTLEMLSFMKDTDFENRLPALLPEEATVHHKIGTEVRIVHDAGIVTNGKQTYYIGIFTREVNDDPQTEALMAKVSKLVYDYLN